MRPMIIIALILVILACNIHNVECQVAEVEITTDSSVDAASRVSDEATEALATSSTTSDHRHPTTSTPTASVADPSPPTPPVTPHLSVSIPMGEDAEIVDYKLGEGVHATFGFDWLRVWHEDQGGEGGCGCGHGQGGEEEQKDEQLDPLISGSELFRTSGNFLTLKSVMFTVKEKDGNFNITKSPTTESDGVVLSSRQTVDRVYQSMDTSSLTFSGVLGGGLNGAIEVPYTCMLSAVAGTVPGSHVKYSCSASGSEFKDADKRWEIGFKVQELEGEKYTGFGLQFSTVDFTGMKDVPLFVAEQGVGRGEQPITGIMNKHFHGAGGTMFSTYAPSSMWISNKGRSGYLGNTEYTTWSHHDGEEGTVEWNVVGNGIRGGFVRRVGEKGFGGVLEKVTGEVTGRFEGVPEWAYSKGAVVGMQGGEEVVERKINILKEGGVKLAGLWIQDWAGKRIDSFGSRVLWNWELDDEFYPNWEKFLGKMFKQGTRILAYVNPCLSTRVDEFKKHARRDLFKEAEERGFLINQGGEEGMTYVQSSASDEFQFGTVDLTNEDARKWYGDVVIRCNLMCDCKEADEHWPSLLDSKATKDKQCGNGGSAKVGHGGWMADFGEYLPFDTVMSDGTTGEEMHGFFPPTWAGMNSEVVGDMGGDELFFSRSGGLKSPGMASNGGMFWVGDQNTAWDGNDGMKSALTAYLTGGASGFSLTHSDVGGYTSLDIEKDGVRVVLERTEEMLRRWMELSAFGDCMFRSHEGNQADKQIQVWDNAGLTKAFAKWSNIHSMLAPLRKGLMKDAREKGLPLVRGMWFKYGDAGWGNREQYMLGEHMLVSPITDEGTTEKDVWLPKGEWVDFNTCKIIKVVEEEGVNIVVKAEVGKTPVFIVKGDRKAIKVVKRIWRKYKFWDEEGAKECEKYGGLDVGVMLRRLGRSIGMVK